LEKEAATQPIFQPARSQAFGPSTRAVARILFSTEVKETSTRRAEVRGPQGLERW